MSDIYIKSYIAYLSSRKNLSVNSICAYKADLEGLLSHLNKIHIKSLNEAKNTDILDYLSSLDITKTTYNRKVSAFISYYDYQLKQNNKINLKINDLEHVKNDKKYPHTLKVNDIGKMISVIDESTLGIRDKAIIMMLYITGLRVSELINLTFSDINLKEGYIRCIGKGSKEKIIVVGDLLYITLKEYLTTARKEILHGLPCEYLFCNNQAERLKRQSINKMIKTVSEKAEIKMHVSPHTFRHCFATHMLENGADIRSVQEMLGHSDISTTQIYTNITNKSIKNEYIRSFKDPYHLKEEKKDEKI